MTLAAGLRLGIANNVAAALDFAAAGDMAAALDFAAAGTVATALDLAATGVMAAAFNLAAAGMMAAALMVAATLFAAAAAADSQSTRGKAFFKAFDAEFHDSVPLEKNGCGLRTFVVEMIEAHSMPIAIAVVRASGKMRASLKNQGFPLPCHFVQVEKIHCLYQKVYAVCAKLSISLYSSSPYGVGGSISWPRRPSMSVLTFSDVDAISRRLEKY